MSPHDAWQAVLGELELVISKPNFQTWFKNSTLLCYEEGNVIICLPNNFYREWFEKKYHSSIVRTLERVTGVPVRAVQYSVGAALRAPAGAAIPFSGHLPQELSESALPLRQEPTNPWGLNLRHTFATFVVGKNNELAHAAAKAVADRPGDVYNPLFIYGGAGLGKTHLLQAVGNKLLQDKKAKKILYVSCEKFVNDFIQMVRSGRAKEFKDMYRTVDALMIDDIQFITGKEETQTEFFHTFNALHDANKQIVLTSDRPPKTIPSLEPRLLSRLEMGLTADVSAPDLETRIAILEAKCVEKGFLADRDVLTYIATVVQHNVRELEGALNKLVAYWQLKQLPPTLDLARSVLAVSGESSFRRSVTPRQLIAAVSQFYDLAIEELLGKSREKRLAYPRQIIMYLMRAELKSSYPAIGDEIGGRDHTTAMHACNKIERELDADLKLREEMQQIRQRLYATSVQ